MAPFDVSSLNGTFTYALLFGAIGMAFGATLEMSGFGDTRKLAAQFYLNEMTVLKVMFSAIVVAAVLIYGASAFGLLEVNRVFVNPTYLWPGILGGLVMGVGFVVGGFCPGTSLVAASTLKVDGMMFVLGTLGGVFAFGESVSSFESFWLSSNFGRFTLPEWLGLPTGLTLLLVVVMALVMFWGAELAERFFGARNERALPSFWPGSKPKIAAAALLTALALVVLIRGQPTALDRYREIAPQSQGLIDERAIFVSPAEVAALRLDPEVETTIFDLRNERDFNLFHIGGARRVSADTLVASPLLRSLQGQAATAVAFLAGNGETSALTLWKALKGEGVPNVYVLEGGINGWLARYPVSGCIARPTVPPPADPETLAYDFRFAAGSALPSAWPERTVPLRTRPPCQDEDVVGGAPVTWPDSPFVRKVKLQVTKAVKGGCG